MKKKFFGLFLVTAALFSVGTLESCKDNDSDLYNEVLIKGNQQYTELKGKITALEQTCETLQGDVTELKTKIADLKAELADLADEVASKASQADLDALEVRVNALEAEVETLKEQMKLKGVTVHSVYTPAFGSFNSAFGLNSNVLLGYYGKITTGDPNFGGGKGLEGGDVCSDNIGTLYVTVDPLNVDAREYEARLVNSLGESAGVTMSSLEKADRDIKFGYTRAEGNNYLYQTTAKLESADDVKHLSLDVQGYKDALKDLINYKDGVNLGNIASLIYNTVHSDLSANALEVSYKDETVISKYEISAALVKPLSLATVETLNNIDGVMAADKLAAGTNKLVNKVQTLLTEKIGTKIIGLNVEHMSLAPTTGGVTVTIPKSAFTGVTLTTDVTFTIPAGDFASLFNTPETEINKLIDQVNGYVSKINNAWTKVTTPGAGSELIDKAIEVLVNKTLPIAQRATHLVNPTLFVVDGDNIKRLSTIEAAPTVIENAEVDLFITSYSLELAVPFYQKYISAKDVKIVAEEGGDDLNGKVFPGTTMRAQMSVTAAGTKKITYQVADYNGEIRQVEYYVTK